MPVDKHGRVHSYNNPHSKKKIDRSSPLYEAAVMTAKEQPGVRNPWALGTHIYKGIKAK